MRRNMGEDDQVLRIAAASALLILALAAQGVWWWLLVPAAVLFVTGFTRSCPLYRALGMDTLQGRRRRSH